MKRIFLILGLTILSQTSWAQDPEFTQFYNNPLYTNPATAGMEDCGGAAFINFRNQWPSLPGPFVTTTLSAYQNIAKIEGALGLNYLHDVAGELELTTNQSSAIYSYNRAIGNDIKLKVGIEPQYVERTVDYSKLRFADQIQANRGFVTPTSEPLILEPIRMFNLNSGIFVHHEKFYAGIAVHNILEPEQSFYGDSDSRLPRRFTIHGGYKMSFGTIKDRDHFLQPNVLYMKQNKFEQMNLTLRYHIGPVITGIGVRQTFGQFPGLESVLTSLGVHIRKVQLVYSYDSTVSDLKEAAPFSHEISLRVKWCRD
jgi:type IX secretion system PorP/SprF family membrane protein